MSKFCNALAQTRFMVIYGLKTQNFDLEEYKTIRSERLKTLKGSFDLLFIFVEIVKERIFL